MRSRSYGIDAENLEEFLQEVKKEAIEKKKISEDPVCSILKDFSFFSLKKIHCSDLLSHRLSFNCILDENAKKHFIRKSHFENKYAKQKMNKENKRGLIKK